METGSRLVDGVSRVCGGDAGNERALRAALVDEIRRHVPFDFYAWVLTDPETEVGSAPLAVTPSLPDLPRLIRAKYLTTLNRWTSLVGAAALAEVTGDDRGRSVVWRDVLSTYGVGDVASLVFRDAHGCWGFLDLWRVGDEARFSPAEVAALAAVAEPITAATRRSLAATFVDAPVPIDRIGPVMLVLSPALEVRAQTPETDSYLRSLIPPEGGQPPIPAGAYHVAAQLLAVEAGVDAHPPSARVHLSAGAWMTLRAARVGDGDASPDRDIAVSVEPCSPAERRSLYTRLHALTARETDVVDLLARGADTRALAGELHLSPHTVQDHLKAIFAKTGTGSRRELLARMAG